ncbi:hypothetical protein HRED_10911 [Candidatus Haloredivivus sp. G17]|nr:hypothetical protein HRED_10911 [Candidatus Haloredivivus sp. G17]
MSHLEEIKSEIQRYYQRSVERTQEYEKELDLLDKAFGNGEKYSLEIGRLLSSQVI